MAGISKTSLERLRPFLEATLRRYHRREFLASDPVQFVHRYADPRDQEVVGLLAAWLAFGSVGAIERSVSAALATLGARPAGAVARYRFEAGRRALAGFRHRWVSGDDLAALLTSLGGLLDRHGSLGALAGGAFARRGSAAGVIEELTGELLAGLPARHNKSRGLGFCLASPAGGSACKRLSLYLRWMVRADEIDLGLWREQMPASALRLPLDTHLARIVGYLGLTRRRSASWAMAEEATAGLARLDPDDPVRFDFALARLGISGDCLHRRIPQRCAPCPIGPVCRLGRSC